MKAEEERAAERLRAAGHRPSAQRLAVWGYLRGVTSHPTAEEVHGALKGAWTTLSRTTVYQTLEMLCGAGLARQVPTEGGEMRFDGNAETHGHFVCRRCGRVLDFPLAGWSAPRGPAGCRAEETQVILKGVCGGCGGGE